MAVKISNEPLAVTLKARFKRARIALGISQKKAAKILAVSQRQVSDYENERQEAVPTEEDVRLLETRADEKRAVLDSLSVSSQLAPPRLVSEDAFYESVRKYLVDWDRWRIRPEARDDLCEVFIFGAEGLPIFYDQRAQDLWSNNLKRQVNYHLFGLLDKLKRDPVQDAFITLRKIETKAASEFGKEGLSQILVHGILASDSQADEGTELYRGLVDSMKTQTQSCVKVEKLIHLQENAHWLRAIRLGGSSPLMVVRVRPNLKKGLASLGDIPLITFAARRLENVSLVPEGLRETGWLFLDTRTAGDIAAYMDEISRDWSVSN